MSDLNNCTFTGRLTRDAETLTVGAKQTTLTKFGMANNTGFGQYEKTSFFNVQIWGRQGEALLPYLKKGKAVAVAGELVNDKFQGRDGEQHDSWVLTARSISLLSSPQQTAEPEQDPEEVAVY